MSRGSFCVYCGAEDSSENPVVSGVCLKCKLKRGELAKVDAREYKFDLCRVCYSVRVGYKWFEAGSFSEALSIVVENYLINHIKPSSGVEKLEYTGYEHVTEPSWRTTLRLYFKIVYGGREAIAPLDVVVSFNPDKCPRCRMHDSGEYEAVVQLRGLSDEEFTSILNTALKHHSKLLESVIEIASVRNGVDVYLSSGSSARKLAKALTSILKTRYSVVTSESYEEVRSGSGGRARLTISIKVS